MDVNGTALGGAVGQIALDVGMNRHLAKPYDIPKIMKTLKELLD